MMQRSDPDAVMGVFPSDHVVGKPAVYRARGASAAMKGACAGQLDGGGNPAALARDRLRLRRVSTRRRRPAEARAGRSPALSREARSAKAKRYMAAGNFYWNSGMFFWRADVLLEQLRQHLPKTATILAALPRFGSRRFAR